MTSTEAALEAALAEPKAGSGPHSGSQDPVAFLKAAAASLAAGDARAALQPASDACRSAPRLPQAHYLYGQTWLALNEPVRAEQAFAAALQLAPTWADAWVNYGVANYRQGAIEKAKTAMRQALLSEPGHPAASANLGAFLRITGEPEAAEALLQATVAREPDNAGARLNLAAEYLHREQASQALALLDQASEPEEPAQARHWHLQRALALLQLGRSAEARTVLDRLAALGPIPPALLPLMLWRLVLLALSVGDPAGARTLAAAMEGALWAMGPEAVPEHRIMGHYDLAKFWSGQDENPRAFSHWTAGHRLLAKSQPFSRAEHLAFIEANVAVFDRDRFSQGPRAGNRDPAPVFIVGMPRSGTTLCEQILAAHRDVHGAGERAALGRMVAALGGGGWDSPEGVRSIASLDAEKLDQAAAAFLEDLHALAPEKARIIDKMPANYLHLGLVGLMLPGAKIIHCVRDPRDIGLSIFTFRFHGHHGYAHDLADLGWTIRQQSRLMDHWKAVLPNPIMTVALQDWVQDFDRTLARVLDHLGLSPDPNCARFFESDSPVHTVSRSQVRQPINARGLGRWRSYEKELAPLIAELGEFAETPAASGTERPVPSR